MCGISGLLSPDKPEREIERIVDCMSSALRHRGPDANGLWTSKAGIGFGHARLAIIDLSDAGSQPMSSASGRHVLCFNGEIYNYREIRKHLDSGSVVLRGHSDTEVILECIDRFGLEWTLQRAHGMFALALWNCHTAELTLARDRFGEKPLYYGKINNDFVFASELTPFRTHPQFEFKVNNEALSAFVKYNYVPSPLCMLDGFRKLPAGTCISGCDTATLLEQQPEPYWRAGEAALRGMSSLQNPQGATVNCLESVLEKVIARQMISDVPLGSFLSGGVDSSLVTALMQKQSGSPVKTFTIGFNEKDYDESAYASAIAKHLGTDHTEWVIDQDDVLDLIPDMAAVYDEPFADASQLPTTLLSRLTRKDVTVCLSGDGGDELFAGYHRYHWANKVNRWLSHTPRPVTSGIYKLYKARSRSAWVNWFDAADKLLPISVSRYGYKFFKLAEQCRSNNPEALYDLILSYWYEPSEVLARGRNVSIVEGKFNSSLNFMENMMLHDSGHYLVDDIMVKVDRAAMSASLESRAPFLDHEVFETAWSLPLASKFNSNTSKLPLREILFKHVPRELIERPKKGFSVPLEHWFRNQLKDWIQDKLNANTLASQGFFRPEIVQQYLGEHLSGKCNRHYHLWSILSFQAWYDEWSKPQ